MRRERAATSLHSPSTYPPILRQFASASDPSKIRQELNPELRRQCRHPGSGGQAPRDIPSVKDTWLQTLNALQINHYNYGHAQRASSGRDTARHAEAALHTLHSTTRALPAQAAR